MDNIQNNNKQNEARNGEKGQLPFVSSYLVGH